MRITAVVAAMSIALAVLALPQVIEAQPTGKVYRVGLIGMTPVAKIMSDPVHPFNSAFRQEMRERGDVDGKNLVLELRSVEGRPERTSEIVAELIRLNVDVVVTTSSEMTRDAKGVTSTLPIVMAGTRDPVEAGFAASLARPGGNITGLTIDVGEALEAKRLELLRETFPTLRTVAFLGEHGGLGSTGRQRHSGRGRSIRAGLVSRRAAV